MQHYEAPFWLPNGHLQTIWGSRCSRDRLEPSHPPRFVRERWDTPDGDFVDVDFLNSGNSPENAQAIARQVATTPSELKGPANSPTKGLVLFHGLEGDSSSAYSQAFATLAQARGWAFAVVHFRGCSGEINRAPRAYHSGDFEEIDWMLHRLQAQSTCRWQAVGISLGGNALLRWAQERGETASSLVNAVSAICSPLDLVASGAALGVGFNRLVYARMFLKTMKRKAKLKWRQHPGLFDLDQALRSKTLADFDNVFTAPLHGFKDTADYWQRASSKPHLQKVRLPALVLNAQNDPFIPAESLPTPADASPWVTLWQPKHGGHVGFPVSEGVCKSHVLAMPEAVMGWFDQQAPAHG